MEHARLYWPWWCPLCLFCGLCALRSVDCRWRQTAGVLFLCVLNWCTLDCVFVVFCVPSDLYSRNLNQGGILLLS